MHKLARISLLVALSLCCQLPRPEAQAPQRRGDRPETSERRGGKPDQPAKRGKKRPAEPPAGGAALVENDVRVAMRDGVELAMDIARPRHGEPVPVTLNRTPYGKKLNAKQVSGFRGDMAMVEQDVRGRFASGGTFYPWVHEASDGYDTIEWLASQPWCDGNVYMSGASYAGYVQLAAAMAGASHLRAVRPSFTPADVDRFYFQGGALRQSVMQAWLLGRSFTSPRVLGRQVSKAELSRWRPYRDYFSWSTRLPLSDAGPIAVGGESYARAWTDIVGNWEDPTRWQAVSPVARAEEIGVPVLITSGYYDIFAGEQIDLVQALRARGASAAARQGSQLVIGPWAHGLGKPVGEERFAGAMREFNSLTRGWSRQWSRLRPGARAASGPAIHAYVIGQDRWIGTDVWPPASSSPTRLYLDDGALRGEPPPAAGGSRSFVYDPADPVPTLGGNNLKLPSGIHDHRALARRADVLSFESEPLTRETVVVGPLRAHLWVSTSAPDTDFTAMLLDVRPDGYRVNVQDGIVRLRYRNGRRQPQLVEPGEVVAVDVDMSSTGYAFKPGHRIALHVSSSNFPRFDRHMNSAEAPWRWTTARKATNTVYFDASRSSYVELPVLQ